MWFLFCLHTNSLVLISNRSKLQYLYAMFFENVVRGVFFGWKKPFFGCEKKACLCREAFWVEKNRLFYINKFRRSKKAVLKFLPMGNVFPFSISTQLSLS